MCFSKILQIEFFQHFSTTSKSVVFGFVHENGGFSALQLHQSRQVWLSHEPQIEVFLPQKTWGFFLPLQAWGICAVAATEGWPCGQGFNSRQVKLARGDLSSIRRC